MSSILNMILASKKLTRSALARKLNLSQSSIVKYIQILADMGLIEENGVDVSTGGRRSAFLGFNPEVGVNISIVFNVTFLHGALVNPIGEVIFEVRETLSYGLSKERILEKLLGLIKRLYSHALNLGKKVFGVGIGIGGYIDMGRGISHTYSFSRGWEEVDLRKLVESQYDLPFFLINDVDAGALGERYYGDGVGVDNFLYLWVSESVGMGLVLNGDIYLGKQGYVGEIGHTIVIEEGPLCSCGNRGCLETVSSEKYILEQCRDGIERGVVSDVLKLCGGRLEELKIEHVIKASNDGDKLARNIFEEVGNYIGIKLADVANILNPELIILGGSVFKGNSFLLETVKRNVEKRVLRPIANSIKIMYSQAESDMRILGVSSYILRKYFSV